MSYRDRGLMKWQPVCFITEQASMLKQAEIENAKIPLAEIDEHELDKFEEHILLAMEFAKFISVD